MAEHVIVIALNDLIKVLQEKYPYIAGTVERVVRESSNSEIRRAALSISNFDRKESESSYE